MDTTNLNGSCEVQKSILKQKFAALTENDLLFEDGKKEEIIEKI
ncbi:general stress protein CsbD [Flavobacterium soyangense]|uniref:General stress protein CsbD n=1 Tax=Flavobacterium soyangense TaxID=2023265 RepID=A0A930UAP6_9FLAO|nr:general stress protein CsbD [Flavobacterium soyangense]MBF2708622.1 general stress protein CsbD [Flavobacterium soyangense]